MEITETAKMQPVACRKRVPPEVKQAAAALGKRSLNIPKTMTEAALLQRRNAAISRESKKKAKKI